METVIILGDILTNNGLYILILYFANGPNTIENMLLTSICHIRKNSFLLNAVHSSYKILLSFSHGS